MGVVHHARIKRLRSKKNISANTLPDSTPPEAPPFVNRVSFILGIFFTLVFWVWAETTRPQLTTSVYSVQSGTMPVSCTLYSLYDRNKKVDIIRGINTQGYTGSYIRVGEQKSDSHTWEYDSELHGDIFDRAGSVPVPDTDLTVALACLTEATKKKLI
jgi:hypothetical protein